MNTTAAIEASGLPLTILPELEDLLPALSPEEKSALRLSVENEGVRDSLLVWRTVTDQDEEARILIDGHNRFRITESLGRDVEQLPVKDIDFADIEEAKAWIITNQLMRRNLTDAQRSHFRGLAYQASKGSRGGDRKSNGQSDHLIDGGEKSSGNICPLISDGKSTAEKLAEQFNVSPRTIRNDAAFAKRVEALPPEEKAAVLRGVKKLPKAARARPSTPAKETPPEAPQKPSEAIELTPDSVADIVIEKPHRGLYLVFRSITRATDYFTSLESFTSKEYDGVIAGIPGLRDKLESLIKKIKEIPVVESDVFGETNTVDIAEDGPNHNNTGAEDSPESELEDIP